jgi:hypothetical protein
MNMCCLVTFHMNVLTLFKSFLNKGAYVNAEGANEEMLLYLICEDNHDGVISILCMIFNLFFLFHKS